MDKIFELERIVDARPYVYSGSNELIITGKKVTLKYASDHDDDGYDVIDDEYDSYSYDEIHSELIHKTRSQCVYDIFKNLCNKIPQDEHIKIYSMIEYDDGDTIVFFQRLRDWIYPEYISKEVLLSALPRRQTFYKIIRLHFAIKPLQRKFKENYYSMQGNGFTKSKRRFRDLVSNNNQKKRKKR